MSRNRLTAMVVVGLLITGSALVAGESAAASGSGSNLWPNPGFESGSGGLPSGWSAGGTDTSMAQWSTATAHGGSHSLCVVDGRSDAYGTATASQAISASASYELGWFEGYATSKQMSVSVGFKDSGGATIGSATVLPVSGNSNGWLYDVHEYEAPSNAASIFITVSSTIATVDNSVTGSICLDDVSLLLISPTSLGTGTNVWPNSNLETDTTSGGYPDGWNKGGSDPGQDSWSTATAYDGTHSLCVVDSSASAYGEWYSKPLPVVQPGLVYELRWEQGFSTGGSNMYYQAVFYDQSNTQVGSPIYYAVNGYSAGWQAAVHLITAPSGASKLSIHITSDVAATGSICLDAVTLAPANVQDPQSGENVVSNPMLELDSNSDGVPDSWSKTGPTAYQGQATWSSTTSFSSSHSLCVARPSASNPTKTEEGGWLSDPIPVQGGATYLWTFQDSFTVSFQSAPATSIDMFVGAVFYDSSGYSISNSLVMANGSSGGWQKESRMLLAPANAASVRLQINGNTYSSGTICADDFFISGPVAGLTPYVKQMLGQPANYSINNWSAISAGYTSLAFSGTTVDGSKLPVSYTAGSTSTPSSCTSGSSSSTYTGTYTGAAFSLPSYLGEANNSATGGSPRCEALPDLGALYGATLNGTDMGSYGGTDYVSQIAAYYSQITDNSSQTRGLIYDNPSFDGKCADWYTAYPTILWAQLLDHYSSSSYSSLRSEFLAAADSWKSAIPTMTASHGQFWCYNFVTGSALSFGQAYPNWATDHPGETVPNVYQPDVEIGAAWIEYLAWQLTGTTAYLTSAEQAMSDIATHQSAASTPNYEVLGFFGPLLAAKMNANNGQTLPVDTFLNWIFNNGYNGARSGYGMLAGTWGGKSVNGLVGGSVDWGGYAFGMDTNVAVGAIAPLARYSPHNAATIGAWIMNVASNEKALYDNGLPSANQSEPSLATSTGESRVSDIPYEGLKHYYNNEAPYGTSDAQYFGSAASGWSDRGTYSAWSTAVLDKIGVTTNVSGVLSSDLLVTDTKVGAADPSYLYYNPNSTVASVTVNVGSSAVDLYDAVSHSFVAKNVSGSQTVTIAPQSAAVLVFVPHTTSYTVTGSVLSASGVAIDFEYP